MSDITTTLNRNEFVAVLVAVEQRMKYMRGEVRNCERMATEAVYSSIATELTETKRYWQAEIAELEGVQRKFNAAAQRARP